MRASHPLSASETIKCKQIQTNFRQFSLESQDLRIAKNLFLNGTDIKCVKFLGVTVDFLLNLYLHVSNICKNPARQINVLLRRSRLLSTDSKEKNV